MAKGLRSKIKRGFKKERVALIRAVPYLEAREAKRQAIMDAVMDAPTITEKDATGMEAEATEETVSAPAEDSDVDMAPGVGRCVACMT